ncbi:MAG: hypothetical protein IT373_10620 [Polyangiaceae bacterium]|nr:hypothetical protein [Polyangiaceae bacterium]
MTQRQDRARPGGKGSPSDADESDERDDEASSAAAEENRRGDAGADDVDDDERDSDEGADEDDERDSDEGADERDSDEGADEDDERDSDEGESPGAGDERAQKVARSLGVSGEDEGVEEGEDKTEAARNRAERRREQALARKAGRAAGAPAVAEDRDEDDVGVEARDRNKRLREEFLRKRRATAEAQKEDAKRGLAASEMVDDALARGASAFTKWLRRSWRWLSWVVFIAIVGGLGVWWYLRRTVSVEAKDSDELYRAVALEQAAVGEDKRDDEEKKKDPRPVFPTADERAQAVADAYAAVVAKQGKSGTALLAKLGEAGGLLEARKYDEAAAAYDVVLASPLAAADLDVRARALEGKGFALEGKRDLDGAEAVFGQLEGLDGPDAPGTKQLAALHLARVLVAKGDKNAAKELLVAALKDLEVVNLEAAKVDPENPVKPYRWLPRALERALRAIDPSAVPQRTQPGLPGGKGGAQIPPELLEKLSPEERKKVEDMFGPGGKGLPPPGAPEDAPAESPEQGPPE